MIPSNRRSRSSRPSVPRSSLQQDGLRPLESSQVPSASPSLLGRMCTGTGEGARPTSGPRGSTMSLERALPRALRRALSNNGWSLAAVTPQGTLVWERPLEPVGTTSSPRPMDLAGWSEESHWTLRKAVRAYGLGTHPLKVTGTPDRWGIPRPTVERMGMFRATPFVAARPIDRARTGPGLLFDAHGRLPSCALVIEDRLVMPKVPRVNTRWHERLVVEPADVLTSESPHDLTMWLRHAFAECDINPYPVADVNEIDGAAGDYALAYPVLIVLAQSVGLNALAKVLRAAWRREQAWAREQEQERNAEWHRLERSLALARR